MNQNQPFLVAGPLHRTAQSAVVEQLRREILSGALPAGSRLIQSKIAARLHTSTTPVREAMRQLAAEGLLRIDAHRGVVVHRPTRRELADLYELRHILEPHSIANTVRHITPEQLDAAERLVQRMDAENDYEDWVTLNRDFHAKLCDAAGSPRTAALLRNLRDLSMIYVGVSMQASGERLRSGNDEHRKILDACRSGDVQAAQDVVRRHMRTTLELGTSYLTTMSETP